MPAPNTKLTKYLEKLRKKYPSPSFVPDFEWRNGGDDARILMLFEKPGRMTVTSGRVSQYNQDQTAARTKECLRLAGVDTNTLVIWNVISAWNGVRRITQQEIKDGEEDIRELLQILADLKTVILVGRRAQALRRRIDFSVPVIRESCHPSPINRAARRELWDRIPEDWRIP